MVGEGNAVKVPRPQSHPAAPQGGDSASAPLSGLLCAETARTQFPYGPSPS